MSTRNIKRQKREDYSSEEELVNTEVLYKYLYKANDHIQEYKKETCKLRIEAKYQNEREKKLTEICDDLERKCSMLEEEHKGKNDPKIKQLVQNMTANTLGDYEKLIEAEQAKKQRDFMQRCNKYTHKSNLGVELVKK